MIYTNARGQSVDLGDTPPFVLSAIDGLGDVAAINQTQKAPSQDGSTYINSVLDERFITMEVGIVAPSQAELSNTRQFFSSVFNPKLGEGTLTYIFGDKTKEIAAVPEHVPVFPSGADNRIRNIQRAIVSLRCPNPYWTTRKIADQLVVWESGLTFPLRLPTKFASQSESKAKILLNDGDVDTPVNITFNGPATSPIKVINQTTGDFIEVKQSLLADEKLEINTAFGQKRVTKVLADGTKQNAFHHITLGSSFFQLVPGNNLIDYSTGADYERAGVHIIWRNRFLSV